MKNRLARVFRRAEATAMLELAVGKEKAPTWIGVGTFLAVHGVTVEQVQWVAQRAADGTLPAIIDLNPGPDEE